jgi:cysteine desulfurase
MARPIYLDHQATTPMAPEAVAAMLPYLDERFGNPHSPHLFGREADAGVAVAREQVAGALGVAADDLIFTSGATESVNLALKGVIAAAPPGRRRLVTIATEHACVLESAEWLARQGAEVVVLPVDGDGLVDMAAAEAAIDHGTALLSVMAVNNEIGVIQPVDQLAALARAAGALVHVDAAQSFGKLPVDAGQADLISLSAHKLYGPKGIGALWVRKGIAIAPVMHGGGQEGRGLRSGTLAPALCAGFGAAAAVAVARMADDAAHVDRLWDIALAGVDAPGIVNGSTDRRFRGNLNLRLPGVDASRLISDVRRVAFSAASACASGSGRPSHVLSAIGLSAADARSSIRLGWGRYTREDEMKEAIDLLNQGIARQRKVAA